MIKIEIEKIDISAAPKIAGIYAIILNNEAYIGKSNNIFSRLKAHKGTRSIAASGEMYILEAYKDITNFDLMIMEDFYICKFEALGYKLENKYNAMPRKIKEFIVGKKRSIKLYKQFYDCEMKSNIFNFKIKTSKTGRKRVYFDI